MEIDSFDKKGKKFGETPAGVDIEKEYYGDNPETVFINELLQVSGPNVDALDVGCADGRFTLSIADKFRKIEAIDISDVLLESAKKYKEQFKVDNVNFKKVDIFHNKYFGDVFEVVYSKQGPTDYITFERILVPGGRYVGILTGEDDARDIKHVFAKEKDSGKNNPVMKTELIEAHNAGLNVLCAGMYLYTEYYKTSVDLSRFLESEPIIPDYDPVADRNKLAEYIAGHKTDMGIALNRQKIVIVAEKP